MKKEVVESRLEVELGSAPVTSLGVVLDISMVLSTCLFPLAEWIDRRDPPLALQGGKQDKSDTWENHQSHKAMSLRHPHPWPHSSWKTTIDPSIIHQHQQSKDKEIN
jgi:hypothetical protein